MDNWDNIIKQLVFDVQVNGHAASLEFGNEVAEYCAEKLVRVLESYFEDQFPGRLVSYELLELDLGNLNTSDWMEEISEKMLSELENTIELANGDVSGKKSSEIGWSESRIEEQLQEALQRQLVRSHGTEHVADIKNTALYKDGIQRAFVYYLDKGRLPWWYPTEGRQNLTAVFVENLDKKAVDMIIPLIKRNDRAQTRFLNGFNSPLINSFLKLSGVAESLLSAKPIFYQALTDTITPGLKKEQYTRGYFDTLLNNSLQSAKQDADTINDFLMAFISRPSIRQEIISNAGSVSAATIEDYQKKLKKIWPFLDLNGTGISNTIDQIKKLLSGSRTFGEHTHINIPDHLFIEDKSHIAGQGRRDKEMQNRNKALEPNDFNLSDQESIEGVYVDYAGIILLHPFMAPFFKALGLLINGQWKDEKAQLRAVQLLAYLATGKTNCPEYSGLLFKHLCGVEWETPVHPKLKIKSSERKEAQTLMQTVVSHWQAVGSTTPEGLREGFFDRDGKLCLNENGWQLFIEQRAQDILLQQIPWGIGMAKFPWTDDILTIHWI